MTYPPTFPRRLRYVLNMSSTRPAPLRNVRHREMDRDDRPAAYESRRFPGYKARLTSHTHCIRTAICECGSGRPYGECCMKFDHQRSRPGIQHTARPQSVEILQQWWAIEDAFRISAFHTFYKAFREEHDPTIRFIRALLTSAKAIDDHQQILAWHREFRHPRRRHDPGGGAST